MNHHLLAALLAILTVALAQNSSNSSSPDYVNGNYVGPDPFYDPAHDVHNPLRYIPSLTLTAVAESLFSITVIGLLWRLWRYGPRWMTLLIVSVFAYLIGLELRFGLSSQPRNLGLYITMDLLIVLSPCGFIATNYILLGHLSDYIDGDKHLLVPRRRLTRIFVLSDIFTFSIQGGGGGLSTAPPAVAAIGAKAGLFSPQQAAIFLAGLILQLISFVIFTVMYLLFLYRVRKHMRTVWGNTRWNQGWKLLALALLVSCVGILIRSVYRTIELYEGYSSYLTTTEAYFYGLDALPLYIAITVYVPFWPGQILVQKNDSHISMAPLPDLEHTEAEWQPVEAQ